MNADKLDVTFSANESQYDNCVCDCCHSTGHVLKLRMPQTLYFDHKNLSTKYSDLWICNDCRNKLVVAMQGGRNER